MAIQLVGVGTTAILVKYNNVDLTDHVKSLTITMDVKPVEVTAMNASAVTYSPGLRDDSVDIEFYQDFATSSVNQTVKAFLGSASGATLLIQSSGATVNATNPKWTVVASPYSWSPMDGAVGDAAMTKVKFQPVAGSSIVEATS